MSGDISNKNANTVLIVRNEIVKIAGHGGHGTIRSSDEKVAQFGTGAGENRGLNLAGNLKFVFNHQQSVLV